ncbi:hypothetical protein M422DRAFT_69044 [Sphaerobolus stellatus SS14]|uniref:Uncharacterized protein n=1 Tax=Sphaerobolus stellatus (strain SS14) TaxID=990650 RepID=A0A0C9VLJ9_SPHS4|nr:hypothetical protein M422DRAFT_69044 [Sphaerobolus stellatus SS14]
MITRLLAHADLPRGAGRLIISQSQTHSPMGLKGRRYIQHCIPKMMPHPLDVTDSESDEISAFYVPQVFPPPKPSWVWSTPELNYYRIQYEVVPADKFFHGRKLSKARFKEPFWNEILTAQYPEDAKVSEVKEFIHSLIAWKDYQAQTRLQLASRILQMLDVVDTSINFAMNGPFCFKMNGVLMKACLPCAFITSEGYCLSSVDDVGRYRLAGLKNITNMDQLDSPVASLVAQAIAVAEHNFTRSLL